MFVFVSPLQRVWEPGGDQVSSWMCRLCFWDLVNIGTFIGVPVGTNWKTNLFLWGTKNNSKIHSCPPLAFFFFSVANTQWKHMHHFAECKLKTLRLILQVEITLDLQVDHMIFIQKQGRALTFARIQLTLGSVEICRRPRGVFYTVRKLTADTSCLNKDSQQLQVQAHQKRSCLFFCFFFLTKQTHAHMSDGGTLTFLA